MQVRVLTFGVLKQWLGAEAATIELPEAATVAQLLARVSSTLPVRVPALTLRGIAVSVNAEYATLAHVLHDGDEVGLLPPVSGGADNHTFIALTRDPILTEKLVAAAKHAEDGAVVVFDGIVRNHTRDRKTLFLDYEAYEEMALKQMQELAAEARRKFAVRHVTLVHRLGRLEIGETSVLIVVASAHRAAAFDANRWLIDTLKKTVPIWKHETFIDGAVWAAGEPFPAALSVTPPEVAHES